MNLKYKSPAPNVRFCKMAAVAPQTILCEIQRLSPAASLVEAATSQSRVLYANRRERVETDEIRLKVKCVSTMSARNTEKDLEIITF